MFLSGEESIEIEKLAIFQLHFVCNSLQGSKLSSLRKKEFAMSFFFDNFSHPFLIVMLCF